VVRNSELPSNGLILTREDLVALITKTKLPEDAANGRNIRKLAIQWDNRKHRLNVFLYPPTINNPLLVMATIAGEYANRINTIATIDKIAM
jgi:hypothetical protein